MDDPEEKERKKRKSRVREPVPERPQKVKVRLADGKERLIQSMSETSYWSVDGKPLSAQEFLKSLYGALPSLIQDMATLRKLWSAPDTRKRLLLGLEEKGFGEQAMAEMQKLIMAEKSDLFDVLAYVAFTTPPVTREKRATHAKKMVQADISDQQKAFLDFVLEHYVNQGVKELDDEKLAPLMELKYGSIRDALDKLGQVDDPEEKERKKRKITGEDQITTGTGLVSNQSFTDWEIINYSGTINLPNDKKPRPRPLISGRGRY